MTHQHKEAFCLMWYACECGHRERIWNSRNGVTPFGIGCPSCGNNSLLHAAWDLDTPTQDHRPFVGQRYFASGTAEDAVKIITKRIDNCRRDGMPVPDAVAAALLNDARAQTGEWLPGWPIVKRMEANNENTAARG